MQPALDAGPGGDESFVLGPIGLGYDRGNDRLLVQLEELIQSDEDESAEEGDDETPIAATSGST